MSHTGQRIEEVIKALKITKKEFAKAIDYSPGNITDWAKDRYKPSSKALINMEQVYNINQQWILEGTGSMFKNTESVSVNSVSESQGIYSGQELSADEILLIQKYRKLTKDNQNMLHGYIDCLDQKGNNDEGKSSAYQSGGTIGVNVKKHA